jgi:hypothetical protein
MNEKKTKPDFYPGAPGDLCDLDRLTRTHVYNGKPDTWTIDLTTDGKEVIQ